ncbi:MAG: HAD family hydrolase [Candidatus Humimicrobiaceae bacterium]
MFKLLVTDVDGTLLDAKSKLSELNKKAIRECMASGIKVTIATGKTIDSIRHLISELDLKLPQITMNGASIVTSSGEIIESIKFPRELYIDFLRDVRSKNYEPTVATSDGSIFCIKYVDNMKAMVDSGEKFKIVEDLETPFFIDNTVSISVPMPVTDPMDPYIREKYGSKLLVVRSGEFFFDCLNLNASKGNALKKLLKTMGINKEEVVSFGDSHNDISLFNASGLKIAVKNSFPELLEIADIVTDENYKSGLGTAIYRYILKKDQIQP